jgi:hypothetical protein
MTDKIKSEARNPKGIQKHQETNYKNQTCLRQASLSVVADKLKKPEAINPKSEAKMQP